MRWPWRKRFQVVLIGKFSGLESTGEFLRFRSEEEAIAFAKTLHTPELLTIAVRKL